MNTSHKHGSNAEGREKSSALSTFKKFTVVSVIGLALSISMLSAASDSKMVYITDGDKTYTVTTSDTDTDGIIEKAGLELKENDEAVITEESSERIDINIIRALSVGIDAFGTVKNINAKSGTVADALKAAGVTVSANDFITPKADTEIQNGMKIKVVKGVKIYLTCDGASNIVYVPDGKIGESLRQVGYQLAENDDLNVDENENVKDGMQINVDRVLYRTVTRKQKIAPKTIKEVSDTLPAGQIKVKQEPKEGTIEYTYKQKIVNDELKEEKVISEKVITKSVDKIILVGAKKKSSSAAESKPESAAAEIPAESSAVEIKPESIPVVEAKIISKDESGVFADFSNTESSETVSKLESKIESVPELEQDNTVFDETVQNESDEALESFGSSSDINVMNFSYSKVITGSCTAYTELSGITATGTVPKVGTVAVNPNVIPYGTKLYICSADGSYVYGYAIAEDTGTAAMAGDIVVDLYMESEADCEAFGRQELCVYILD